MNVFHTLAEKPWLTPSSDATLQPIAPINKKLTLFILLTIITVFFSLFIFTFIARSQYADFKALAGEVWQPFYNPFWLWVNTSILAIASAVMQLAVYHSRKNKFADAHVLMVIAAFFSLQFIVAQGLLFRYLYELGYYLASNPANSYFYMLTSLHAVHLAGGILVLLRIGIKNFRNSNNQSIQSGLSLCAIYWHYLFLLWVVLVLLVTSSPETYQALAALCGYA